MIVGVCLFCSICVWFAQADQSYDDEFMSALKWMHTSGITRYDTADQFRPVDIVMREHAAKFMTEFVVSALHQVINTRHICEFKDLEQADPTLRNSIMNSCYLWIFYGTNNKFYPDKPLTKAEALVVLVRAVDGKQPEIDQAVRWENYSLRAREIWLTKETNAADQDREITRYEMAILMYRAGKISKINTP